MKYEELIELCIECIEQHQPDIEGPDSLCERLMKKVSYYLTLFRKLKIPMRECLLNRFSMEY